MWTEIVLHSMFPATEVRNVIQHRALGSFDRLSRIRTQILRVFWELKSCGLSSIQTKILQLFEKLNSKYFINCLLM